MPPLLQSMTFWADRNAGGQAPPRLMFHLSASADVTAMAQQEPLRSQQPTPCHCTGRTKRQGHGSAVWGTQANSPVLRDGLAPLWRQEVCAIHVPPAGAEPEIVDASCQDDLGLVQTCQGGHHSWRAPVPAVCVFSLASSKVLR